MRRGLHPGNIAADCMIHNVGLRVAVPAERGQAGDGRWLRQWSARLREIAREIEIQAEAAEVGR